MIEEAILTAIHARLSRALGLDGVARMPIRVGDAAVGWVDPARAERLARFAEVFEAAAGGLRIRPALATCEQRTAAIATVAEALATEGLLTAWRDERYAVSRSAGEPALFLLERAAARYFGIRTGAAHVNGLVRRNGAPAMWIARRSAAKAIDPGQLDNLVGGGIAAGLDARTTLLKEAQEEAGIPAALAARAVPAAELHICRAQPDGLQRETIHVYDLALPEDFVPRNEDGEVVEHRLVSPAALAALVAHTTGPDVVTADASLVIVDWLLRNGHVAGDSRAGERLAALRHPPDLGDATG